MKLSRRQNHSFKPTTTQPDAREAAPAPAHERVTLEDLLRLKRAEHPAPEFWADFEKQLKQRQLAAAIRETKLPWRRALPATLPRFAIVLSAGAATAALAIGIIGIIAWRDTTRQTLPPAAPAENAGVQIAQTQTKAASDTSAAGAASATHATPAATAAPAIHATDENDWHLFESATPDAPAKPTTAEIAATQPISEERIQMARTAFAAATAATRATDFALVTFANARTATTTRNISSSTLMAMPVLAGDLPAITISMGGARAEKTPDATTDPANTDNPAAEPTAAKPDAATGGDPRYERLLSYMATAAAPAQTSDDNPRAIRVRGQVTSRLNNKVITDSVSRFDATGDSLSIKF